MSQNPPRTVRVLAFIEASWITGPAKNLIAFARRASQPSTNTFRADIAIATFQRGLSPSPNEFEQACRSSGIELHLIRERSAFDPSVLPAMRGLVENFKPNIVQTHAVKSHFLVRLSRVNQGRRWIAFHHGYTWTDKKARLYNQIDRWSLRTANRVVTVCLPFASELESIGIPRKRISIQHNSVDKFEAANKDKVAELRSALKLSPDALVMLSVGRLSREKGQEDLIKALALLRKDNQENCLRLVLVGIGPDGPRLKALAEQSGIGDRVSFEGHQRDVSKYYALADLMVLPSHSEGSPNALLEGMAAGVPIIATSVGGIPEIARPDQEAVLVEKCQPRALAQAIHRVLSEPELRNRISQQARLAANEHSPDAYCSAMLSIYEACIMDNEFRTKNLMI